jgi:hypothetical protein
MKVYKRLWYAAACLMVAGCMRMTIEPVDYSWRIESVLAVETDGTVKGAPKTLSFNAAGLYGLETGAVPMEGKPVIRVIRNPPGYYFMTAPSFRNVYVFSPGIDRLSLYSRIAIDEAGLKQPAFNQRAPYIQLIDGKRSWMLTEKGIAGDGQ